MYILLRVLILIFKCIPFGLLYLLSDFLYIILYHVLGYRKKIVRNNLKNAFPNHYEHERKKIERQFFKNLCDQILETIKGFSMSKKNIADRVSLEGENLAMLHTQQQHSILVLGGHFMNWEWAGLAAAGFVEVPVNILYAPIKNKWIDHYFRIRKSDGKTKYCSELKIHKAFKKNQSSTAAFVMIADQSPSNPRRAHWINFLDQSTAFLKGPASYVQYFNLQPIFIDIVKIKRGYYKLILSAMEIKTDPKEFTKDYAKFLEESILQHPENWLWSHKRWKHSINKQDQL